MLKMASEADLLFSIGPRIHEYFGNAYRAVESGRKLSDIPHDEILPQVKQEYVDNEVKVDPGMQAYSLLTYGQLDTQKALEHCKSMAASIGTAANKQAGIGKDPEWKIQGVSANADETTTKFLTDKVQSWHVKIKLYKSYSTKILLRHLQQSHLCIPPSCYEDYSFEGLEAMASGLPTTVCDDSHIASLITKYFEEYEDFCVVEAKKLSSKITDKLNKISKGFKQAKLLKRSLVESEAIQKSLANFTAMLKRDEILTSTFTKINEETVQMEGQNDKTAAQTDTEDTVAKHAKSSEREGQRSRKRAVVDHEKLVTQQYAGAEQVQPKVQRIESTKQGPPFEVGPPREQNSGNNNIVVNVSLNEGYRQEETHLDRQPQTISVMELESSWERCNEELNMNVEQVIANSGSTEEVNHIIYTTVGDGGGLGPVKVLQDIIEPEDAEEILILPNITGSVESADVSHDSSEEEKHQQFKDKKALEGKQSEPEPERAILESQLDGAKREKAVLEERCKELTQKLESTEKAMVSQRVKNREKREKMQSQLEEQERLIKELQNKPGESGQKLEQPDLQKEEEKGVEKTEETVDVEKVKSLQDDSSIMQPIKESAVTGGVPRSTVEAVTNISSKAEKQDLCLVLDRNLKWSARKTLVCRRRQRT
ncbi:DNA ligase 1-like [Ptychodera flava]|uniref:DNA ligase 1-like n=1 Tax=Ptychodera flava TaxID=63121 RepID=UPI003969F3C7